MVAAANPALKINDLDLNTVLAANDGAGAAITGQINSTGLIFPEATDPRILLSAKTDPAIWRRAHDPRLHREVQQILRELGDRQLKLEIRTQGGAMDMMRAVREQIAAQLPGGYYPQFLADLTRQVWLFAGQSGAPFIHLHLTSHGDPAETVLAGKAYSQVSAYDGDVRRDSEMRKASLNLTLGVPGAANANAQQIAAEVQPDDGRPYLLLLLGADQTMDTLSMPAQMRLNEELSRRELHKDTVFSSPVSGEVTPETLKEQEILNRMATLDMLAATVMHPDADPKIQKQLVKQLGEAIKEIRKPEVLAKLSVGAAIVATQTLADIATHHPVVKAHPNGIKMALTAQQTARVVEQMTPLEALERMRQEPPANENNAPLVTVDEKQTFAARVEGLTEQTKTLFEKYDTAEAKELGGKLLDDRTMKAIEAQPAIIPEKVAEKLAKVQQVMRMPTRRQHEAKSEAQAELKALDPKPMRLARIEPKSREVLVALQQQLKADPKLRAELAKNKEIAPLVEALEKADFKNPRDVAKLAIQIAKLPKEAKAEIAEKVAPTLPEAARESFKQEWTAAAVEITQAVTLDALVPKLQEPLDALKDAPLAPEQKEKLEALTQQLAEAKDPEALREIAKQISEVIAELPAQITAELPQLKEFTETAQKWEAEPAAFNEFVQQSVEQHTDLQVQAIEQVEAVHLGAEVGAKLGLTLDALKELPLEPEQQAQLQEIMQQLEGAEPAQLKEIIAKLDDLVAALPPETAKQLPPAIAEIHEGLKAADLSTLSQVEIAPQVRAEISSKLELTMSALEDAPLRPADRKQLQEITKQLTSDNPAVVQRAIKQLDQLVAKLPPETKLPPAFTELREALKAVENPAAFARSEKAQGLKAAPTAELRPSNKTIELSAPVAEALKKLQATLKASPQSAGLPFSRTQLQGLIKADLSDPKVRRQVIGMLQQAQKTQPSGGAAKSPAAQQLHKILQQPEIKSYARPVQQQTTQARVKPAAENIRAELKSIQSAADVARFMGDTSLTPLERAYLIQLQQRFMQAQEQRAILLQNSVQQQTTQANAPKQNQSQNQGQNQTQPQNKTQKINSAPGQDKTEIEKKAIIHALQQVTQQVTVVQGRLITMPDQTTGAFTATTVNTASNSTIVAVDGRIQAASSIITAAASTQGYQAPTVSAAGQTNVLPFTAAVSQTLNPLPAGQTAQVIDISEAITNRAIQGQELFQPKQEVAQVVELFVAPDNPAFGKNGYKSPITIENALKGPENKTCDGCDGTKCQNCAFGELEKQSRQGNYIESRGGITNAQPERITQLLGGENRGDAANNLFKQTNAGYIPPGGKLIGPYTRTVRSCPVTGEEGECMKNDPEFLAKRGIKVRGAALNFG